ncbi:hypothetical protein TrST_g8145 [Triparma strigata]|uniref:RNA helicase n=1 Tax=Triparma strigata TaxID=1606541 RepID=A0A9W7B0E4_9STRA|nr:hypothetical protein TrST_g8145 [Triparma strigata]
MKRSHSSHSSSPITPQTTTVPLSLPDHLPPSSLPIIPYHSKIVASLDKNDCCVLTSSTGSGKTTTVPFLIYKEHRLFKEHSKLKVTCTQPRRVACTSVASYVSSLCSVPLGTLIGYNIRFDNCTTPQTVISYQTDYMLLRSSSSSYGRLFPEYGCIIIDEAHERSLGSDFVCSLVKQAMIARNYPRFLKDDSDITSLSSEIKSLRRIVRKRKLPPLKVIVMSATISSETFSKYFSTPNMQAKVLSIPGKTHRIDVCYLSEACEDFVEGCVEASLRLHCSYEEGDILCFLPGREEIDSAVYMLRKLLKEREEEGKSSYVSEDKVEEVKGKNINVLTEPTDGAVVLPLYSSLSPSQQQQIFLPLPANCHRRIIISTNIAETSLTLSNVIYVVDSGLEKKKVLTQTGVGVLRTEVISKASAVQRSGRCGRVRPGLAIRMYRELEFEGFKPVQRPEIEGASLSNVVLLMLTMGIKDCINFDFLQPPSEKKLLKAFHTLHRLKAVNDSMEITPYGEKMSKLPVDVEWANLVLKSEGYGCVKEVLTSVAMLSAENIFYRPTDEREAAKAAQKHRRFSSFEGDIPSLRSVYETWEKETIYVDPSLPNVAKRYRQLQSSKNLKIPSPEWCSRNYINSRSVAKAHSVRFQLHDICKNLYMNVESSCGSEGYVDYLKCVCEGLSHQIALRSVVSSDSSEGSSSQRPQGKYKTLSGIEVNVHPNSTMFQRNPAPSAVVFTEIIVTKKTYITGVTQVKKDWVTEFHPDR